MKNFEGKSILTFDCYGTLIDWEAGICNALRPIFARANVSIGQDEALQLFADLETKVERGPYKRYREVLAHVLNGLAAQLKFTPSPEEIEAFSGSVPNWPAFPDSHAALVSLKQRFKLAVITNCDDDLFAASNKRLGVEFDYIITAQQVGGYKPSLENFRFALKRIGKPQDEILHVAQSLFHDHVPAKQIGLTSVWINRRHNKPGFGATPAAEATPDYEYPDMLSFADAARATATEKSGA